MLSGCMYVITDSPDQLLDIPPNRLGGTDRARSNRTCLEMMIDGFSRWRAKTIHLCILRCHFGEQSARVHAAKNIYSICVCA